MSRRTFRPSLLLVSILALAACGGEDADQPASAPPKPAAHPAAAATPTTLAEAAAPPVKVVGIDVGSRISADKTIGTAATTFAPNDTVYVSVRTEGDAPFVNMQARWHDPANSVILVANQSLKLTGTQATEFHYSTLQGMGVGTWTVELLVDLKPAGTATFEVK